MPAVKCPIRSPGLPPGVGSYSTCLRASTRQNTLGDLQLQSKPSQGDAAESCSVSAAPCGATPPRGPSVPRK